VIDQRRNHALEAYKNSELNGHKHNGKNDADHCGDQSDPIVKEIARRENKDHRATQSMRVACEASNVMVVISTPSLDAVTVGIPIPPRRRIHILRRGAMDADSQGNEY
jgi:hypothetical protein